VYLMNGNGGDLREVTFSNAFDGDPSWSSGGNKKIAFNSNRDGDYEIYVMNADGSGQRNLTDNASLDALPAWSAVISADGGNDRILGGAGADVISGGAGQDVLLGGAGNDLLNARDRARDVVDGGAERGSGRWDSSLDRVRAVEKHL